jgi:hypothetical protein
LIAGDRSRVVARGSAFYAAGCSLLPKLREN